MIKLENITYGPIEPAIRSMRNPMNSWEKSDSTFDDRGYAIELGPIDKDLLQRLTDSGNEHRKALRMMTVDLDIVAPMYWWKQFDTYKVGTACNSCSTMHKLTYKPFEVEDFSHEHLTAPGTMSILRNIIDVMNIYLDNYLEADETEEKQMWWWAIIQIMPMSYNQRRTIHLNYEVLYQMYRQRKHHKLGEWHTFCDWIEEIPDMPEIKNVER